MSKPVSRPPSPPPSKPVEEGFRKPIDMEPKKKKPWYWKPSDDLEASIESLDWMKTLLDPEKEKPMTTSQFNKSMKNFDLWLSDKISEYIHEEQDNVNRNLL